MRRSRKRTRTVSAYERDGKVIVMIPARFTRAEEAEWVETMIARLDKSAQRTNGGRTDAELLARAGRLTQKYLDGSVMPTSVRWVTNMTTRWASCTSGSGTIRMSARLRSMPEWVIDYVLLHELAHLIEPNHSSRFWTWVDRYPKAERAKGYLEGVAAAASLGIEECSPEQD